MTAQIIEVPLKVTEGAYSLGNGVAEFVLKLKTALDDGWQPGMDLPVIVTGVLTDLVPHLQAIGKLAGEAKEAPVEFSAAWAAAGAKIASALVATPSE